MATILGKILRAGGAVIKTAVSAATGVNLSSMGSTTPAAMSAAAIAPTVTAAAPTKSDQFLGIGKTSGEKFMDWIKENWPLILGIAVGAPLVIWLLSWIIGMLFPKKGSSAPRKSGGKTAMQKKMAKVRAARKK